MSTKTYSERLINHLVQIAEELQVDLFEAAIIYCVENDLDEAEFVTQLDRDVVDRLRFSALEHSRVRKCVGQVQSLI